MANAFDKSSAEYLYIYDDSKLGYTDWTDVAPEFVSKEAEGVTEALKATDQLEWVRRMNSIRNRAEEIIKTELIFV